MITRKENLLVRPFQRRKFIEHRKKVNTALPRIDDISPPKRDHVYIKCKKLQTEAERHSQIERDNFILLKHLSDIMKMKRVDNYWLYDHPKFLQRIKLFHQHSVKTSFEGSMGINEFPKNLTKKERCIACHPENYVKKETIPEDRVPWEMKPVRKLPQAYSLRRREEGISFKEKNEMIFNHEHLPNNKLRNENDSFSSTNSKPITIRSSTAPPLGRTGSKFSSSRSTKEKLLGEQSLTVIIKFPPKAQVNLNAGISDKIK